MSYRRLLRVLPTWYQERYADEMVEVHRATGARVGPGEVAATLRLAVSTRLGRAGRPSTTTLWFVALAAVTALAAGAALSTVSALQVRLDDAGRGWQMDPSGRLRETGSGWDAYELLASVGLYRVAWIVVLLLLLCGSRRAALVLGLVTAALDLSAGLGPLLSRDSAFLEVALARSDVRAALLPVLALGALALVGREAPAPAARRRAAVSAATVVALYAAGPLSAVSGAMLVWGDGTLWPTTAVAVALAAVFVILAARCLDPAWAATVFVLALTAVLAGPLPGTPDRTGGPDGIAGNVLLALAAAALAALAWVASTGRRAPAHLAGESSRRRVAAG
ncbi:hypothetical protein [Actinomycetospora soli]|uniref:hypothetical protein n=1 Tax=Actinomycetospora soli TaxID=2893887 RepID=UPI001E338BE5|nr:hypothetical protein [Actinomycetospora soli]MCD2187611.1 hypothetical protein [Actinomycetospora soli]